MKKTILALFLAFISFICEAQTAKSFFIPAQPNNKVTFHSVSMPEMQRKIFYVDHGSSFEIMDVKVFDGRTIGNIQKYIVFSDDDVQMIKSISTNMRETNKVRLHEPPVTIFKLPPTGGETNWTYEESTGDKVRCTSSWTKIIIKGKEHKAVKVYKVIGSGTFTIDATEYYVEGYGYYQTDTKDDSGKLKPYEIFNSIGIDSTIH